MGKKLTPKQLTPKQQKFCDEIVRGTNPMQAYINAYNPNYDKKDISKQAQEALKRPLVKQEIARQREELSNELKYSVKDSFYSLLYAQQMAEEQKNIQAWLKAEELKGKLLGLYTEKIKAEVESKVVQVVFHSEFKGL